MEYGILAPHLDNDGNSLAGELSRFEDLLLEHCGGFTAHDVRGAWKDDTGQIFRDVSTCYTVATSRDMAEQLATILCRDARQLAVYVKLPDGHSVIIHAE